MLLSHIEVITWIQLKKNPKSWLLSIIIGHRLTVFVLMVHLCFNSSSHLCLAAMLNRHAGSLLIYSYKTYAFVMSFVIQDVES